MRRLLIVTFALYALVLAIVGHERVRVFHDDYTLWRDAYSKAPYKARPAINFARAAYDYHKADDATVISLLHRGRELAVARPAMSNDQRTDWYALAVANEGRYWRLHGDLDKAYTLDTAALAEVPQLVFAQAELMLVQMLRSCRFQEASGSWRCAPEQLASSRPLH